MRIGLIQQRKSTTLKDKDKDRALTVYKIQVYARSKDKNQRYYTFCTPECYKAIRDYLDYRMRCGEKMELETETDSDSDNIRKDRSPLFRRRFNKDNPFEINAPRPLGKQAFATILDEILKRSGVKTSETMRSHAFRKGFKSICEQKGMKSLHVEMLMGHNVGLASNYYRPAEFDLLEDYMTHAADSLTINPAFRLQKHVAKLETERNNDIAELRAAVAFLADKVNAAIIANEPSSRVIFNQKGIPAIKITSVNNTVTAPLAKITEENQESTTTTGT